MHGREHAAPLAGRGPVVARRDDGVRDRLRGVKVGRGPDGDRLAGTVDGHRAVIVRSRGKTDGMLELIGDMTWELTSTIDLDARRPDDGVEEAWVEFAGEKDPRRAPRDRDGVRRHPRDRRCGARLALEARRSQRAGVLDRRRAPRRRAVAGRARVHGARAGGPLRRRSSRTSFRSQPGSPTTPRASRCASPRSRRGARSRWTSWTIRYLVITDDRDDRGIA